MPLERIHKHAFKAAQAAHCAGEQGRYWEMHDRLFENYKTLEPWTPHAEAVGLDVAAFEECLASGKFDKAIRRDMGEAGKAGVTGTPAFLIGRAQPGSSKVKVLAVLKGAKAFADFKTELDGLLARPESELDAPAPVAAAPRVVPPAKLGPDGKLDASNRATLEHALADAPDGSPAWFAAPRSDPRAIALAEDLAATFTSAGWDVQPLRRTAVRFRPGVYLLAGDKDPPEYVASARSALARAGLAPKGGTAYRQFYEDKKREDPSFQGFPFGPEQTFLVVIGRVP